MREIGVFVFAASIAIPSASMSGDAGSQIAAAACFWGTTLATVQLVEKLCPDFEPSDSAEDALSIMREHTEFIRCHKVRKQIGRAHV